MNKFMYPIIPPVDIYEAAGEVIVCIDLPGVSKTQLQVSVESNLLEINGNKLPEKLKDGGTFILLEREYGYFNLVIELPSQLEPQAAKAEMRLGVLLVRIPKKLP